MARQVKAAERVQTFFKKGVLLEQIMLVAYIYALRVIVAVASLAASVEDVCIKARTT